MLNREHKLLIYAFSKRHLPDLQEIDNQVKKEREDHEWRERKTDGERERATYVD